MLKVPEVGKPILEGLREPIIGDIQTQALTIPLERTTVWSTCSSHLKVSVVHWDNSILE